MKTPMFCQKLRSEFSFSGGVHPPLQHRAPGPVAAPGAREARAAVRGGVGAAEAAVVGRSERRLFRSFGAGGWVNFD